MPIFCCFIKGKPDWSSNSRKKRHFSKIGINGPKTFKVDTDRLLIVDIIRLFYKLYLHALLEEIIAISVVKSGNGNKYVFHDQILHLLRATLCYAAFMLLLVIVHIRICSINYPVPVLLREAQHLLIQDIHAICKKICSIF